MLILKPIKPTEDKPSKKLTHKEIKKHPIETVIENEHEENLEDDFFILKEPATSETTKKPTEEKSKKQNRVIETKNSDVSEQKVF